MRGLYKFTFKKLSVAPAILIFCTIITYSATAGYTERSKYSDCAVTANNGTCQSFFLQQKDTIPLTRAGRDTLPPSDSLRLRQANDTTPPGLRDTIVPTSDTFNLRMSSDTLDAKVDYQAEDSAVLFVKDQKFILYGKTKINYKDVEVNAPTTEIDQGRNVLTAFGSKDSLGNVIARANFQQGQQKFESESFEYNFKSQKGLTKNTYTHEGEMFIKANVSKKIDANTIYIKEGYFTTCNLDEPHFAFKSNKIKVISNNVAVSGPTHPEFEGVPLPIYLPFGIYPLYRGRHSGIMMPQFANNQQMGLGLEGLGYYYVLNDYLDVTTRANLYSYGGWNLTITPSYRKRYRYNGSFNIAINRNKFA
ncbi:MAG: LPS-assembly protein LptD, partial [Chitinophagaceae bacterium]